MKDIRKQRLTEICERQSSAHRKAKKSLEAMGFQIVENLGPVTNKPWDFVAKKGGIL